MLGTVLKDRRPPGVASQSISTGCPCPLSDRVRSQRSKYLHGSIMIPVNSLWSALLDHRRVLALAVLCLSQALSGPCLHAQFVWSHVLGSVAGHPAHSTYALHVDRTGLLWLSTEHGVLGYDGVRFVPMGAAEALGDALILEFADDSLAEHIWMAAQDGRIFRWERARDRVEAFGRGPGAGGPMTRVRTLLPTMTGGLLVGYDRGNGLDELRPDGAWRVAKVPDARVGLCMTEVPEGSVFYSNWLTDLELLSLRVVCGDIHDSIAIPLRKHDPWATFSDWHRLRDGGVVVSVGNAMYWWSADGSHHQENFAHHVNRIHLDGQGRVWSLEYLGGVRCHGTDGERSDIRMPGLDGVHATDMAHDEQGGLWIGTLGAGLHYLRPYELEVLPTEPGGAPFTTMAPAPGDGLVTGDLDGVVRLWDRSMDQVGVWRLSENDRPAEIKGVRWCEQHQGPEASGPYLIIMGTATGSRTHRTELIRGSYAYNLHHLGGDSLLVLNPYGLTLLPQGPSGPVHDLRLGGRMFELALWNDSLWLAGKDGLFILDRTRQVVGPLLDQPLTDVHPWQGELIAASTSAGLFKRKRDGIWAAWEPHPWTRNTRDLFVAADSSLWLATAHGALGLDQAGRVIWTSDVFPGLEVDGADRVVVDKEKVWLLSHRAIYRMARKPTLELHGLPAPRFSFIQVRDGMMRPTSLPDLRAGDRDITIHFRVSMPFRLGRESYRVRIDDENGDWSMLDAPRIDLFNLGAGSHRIEVQAAIPGGGWGQSAVLDLLVPPKVHETWWARALFASGSLVLVALFSQWRVRTARRRAAQQRTMTDLRMQALTAQLEPHFVFNALNGIQGYLARNDKETAMRYLARFSRLMRGLLEAGQSQVIPLGEELSLLEHYCTLEAMRFTEPFTWSISVAPGLSLDDTGLLPYMVQPYVENAVRHGLWHRTDGGERRLSVMFSAHADAMICCVIEDNGVGRERASMLRTESDRRSVGWAVNMERLKLLAGYRVAADAVIEDLVAPDGKACGTRVTLILPILPVHGRMKDDDGPTEHE